MSGRYWPLSCSEVKQILKNLGFSPRPQKGTSHEQWVGHVRGQFRKVTVDCPKAPFTQDLIHFMRHQAGVSKKEFYAALDPKKAKAIVDKAQEQES